MNKRGETDILVQALIHIILIALIIVPFLFINTKIKDPELIIQKKLTLDLALTRDTLLSSTGNTQITYKTKGNEVSVVEPCKIKVKSKITEFSYPCIQSSSKITVEKEENSTILKNG